MRPHSLLSIARVKRVPDGRRGSSSLGIAVTMGPGIVSGADGVRAVRVGLPAGGLGDFPVSLPVPAGLTPFAVVSTAFTSGAERESALGAIATVCTGVVTGAGVAAWLFVLINS